MGATREWFIRMREEDYLSLPYEQRQAFISESAYYPDEHKELYDTDDVYKKLYNRYRKAKKELDKYKFDKRYVTHGSNS